MKFKCKKCGYKFDLDLYSYICPKCGCYQNGNISNSTHTEKVVEKQKHKPQRKRISIIQKICRIFIITGIILLPVLSYVYYKMEMKKIANKEIVGIMQSEEKRLNEPIQIGTDTITFNESEKFDTSYCPKGYQIILFPYSITTSPEEYLHSDYETTVYLEVGEESYFLEPLRPYSLEDSLYMEQGTLKDYKIDNELTDPEGKIAFLVKQEETSAKLRIYLVESDGISNIVKHIYELPVLIK